MIDQFPSGCSKLPTQLTLLAPLPANKDKDEGNLGFLLWLSPFIGWMHSIPDKRPASLTTSWPCWPASSRDYTLTLVPGPRGPVLPSSSGKGARMRGLNRNLRWLVRQGKKSFILKTRGAALKPFSLVTLQRLLHPGRSFEHPVQQLLPLSGGCHEQRGLWGETRKWNVGLISKEKR